MSGKDIFFNVSLTANATGKHIVDYDLNEYQLLLINVIQVRDICLEEDNREFMSEDIFSVVQEILELKDEPRFLDLKAESYRILRNACAGCTKNQDLVQSHDKIIFTTKEICLKLVARLNSNEVIADDIKKQETVLLRCAAQFIGNAVVGHTGNQEIVWQALKKDFRSMLSVPDENICKYICMVVYNCLKHPCLKDQLLYTDHGLDIFTAATACFTQYNIEWGMFLLEDMVLLENFNEEMYEKVDYEHRTLLLEIIVSRLKVHSDEKDTLTVSEGNLVYIAKRFIDDAYIILDPIPKKEFDELKPILVRDYLDCLCVATSLTKVYNKIKCDTKLLTSAISLLNCMKELGQCPDSVFHEANKITDNTVTDILDPAYGIKSQLIRLVSNMSFKNKANQDLVRELGGISLILDHTNIDEKNPFVTQWAVFAIRNLCDNNMENQAIISGLKLDGLSDKVAELKKFGVEAQIEGDKVVVKKKVRANETNQS